jgi:hypothetical protein
MKTNPELPWRERLDELLLESRTRTLSTAEREELNATLRTCEDARAHAAQELMDDAALAEELRAAQMESLLTADSGGMLGAPQPFAEVQRRTGWLQWRPLTAAAAGVVLGLFCATVAWAMASPRAVATMMRVFALEDGSFEKMSGAVPSGFPKQTGVWSGDASEVVSGNVAKAQDGTRVLRFVRAEGDATVPNSPANSCDVWQLVDLRGLKAGGDDGDATLELSVSFLDARKTRSTARVLFGVRVYAFAGDPSALGAEWPMAIKDALAFGAGQTESWGGAPDKWRTVAAKAMLPTGADFAVVHLVATKWTPRGKAAEFGEQFADNVQFTLKTQPKLPVRVTQR